MAAKKKPRARTVAEKHAAQLRELNEEVVQLRKKADAFDLIVEGVTKNEDFLEKIREQVSEEVGEQLDDLHISR